MKFLPTMSIHSGNRTAFEHMTIRLAGMILLIGSLALLTTFVYAQTDAEAEREFDLKVQIITDGLRCPTCQGTSVKDSDASFSKQIKEKVEKMVAEGQTQEMINAYFVARYGEWILRAPKKEGLGLVLWYSPVVLLVGVGAFLGWRVYRNGKRRAEGRLSDGTPMDDSEERDPLSPEQRARLAQDLKRFEEQD